MTTFTVVIVEDEEISVIASPNANNIKMENSSSMQSIFMKII